MKNKLHNDEALLREKLRGHEFPADEQAWEQMERLLDGTPAPAAPFAGGQPGLTTSFTNGRIFNWVTILGVSALMLFLTVSGSTNLTRTPSEEERKEALPLPVATSQNVLGKDKPGAPARTDQNASAVQKKLETPASTSGSQTAKGGDKTPFVSNVETATTRPLGPDYHRGLEKTAASGTSDKEVHIPQEYAEQPHGNKTLPAEQAPLTAMTGDQLLTAQNSVVATSPLPAIGFQDLQVTPVAPQISAIIQPRKIFRERKTQVGVAVGGQLVLVNRRENVVDLLPALGLSLTHHFSPKWSVQADLMYKKVTGYDFSVEFFDQGFTALGNYGYLRIERSAQELQFLEMPILLKRSLTSRKQAFFAGIRPAWVRAVPGLGSTSIGQAYINQPFKEEFNPSIQDGLRRFDLAVTVGCEVRLWKHFWLDIRHSQGVLDLSYDNFFSNSNTDTTSDTQLTLRYYFWSF